MRNDSPPTIPESPLKAELWIPWLWQNLDREGRPIDVQWFVCASIERNLELLTGTSDQEGYEYAGSRPVYLHQNGEDEARFLLMAPCVLSAWWHVNRTRHGEALVVATRDYLDALLPVGWEVQARAATKADAEVVSFAELHSLRALRLSHGLADPGGGDQGE